MKVLYRLKVETVAAVIAAALVAGVGTPVVYKAVARTSQEDPVAGSSDPASPLRQTQGFAGQDWPCWRGPTRDGIAGPGPKLADAWPEGGPKLLWKAPVPCGLNLKEGWQHECIGGTEGGLGSVTVAGGKAFVYVHGRGSKKKVVMTTKDLNAMGWYEEIPNDVGKKMDEWLKQNKDNGDKKKVAEEFLKSLDPKVAEKCGAQIEKRFKHIWSSGPYPWNSWENLVIASELRDKEFETIENWSEAMQKLFVARLPADWEKQRVDGASINSAWNHFANCMINDSMDCDDTLLNHLNKMGFTYTDTIVCLDASIGKELWKKELGPGTGPEDMDRILASGTPAVADGKCYVPASCPGGLYCVSVKDGSVIWEAKGSLNPRVVEEAAKGKVPHIMPAHSSPLVMGGRVFLMSSDGLTAYEANTGKMLWSQPQIKNKVSSVVSWASGGPSSPGGSLLRPGSGGQAAEARKSYLIASCGGGVACVDPSDGKVVWRCSWWTGDVSGTPLVCGDILMEPNGGMKAIRLTEEKGEVLWKRHPGSANDGSSSLVYQGYIYQPAPRYSGGVRCRDLKTGELKWVASVGLQCTSTIAADGKIYYVDRFACGDHKLRLMMFKATPEKFELLGLGPVEYMPDGSTPSIANGKLYVRLADSVACYDITADGNPKVTPPKSASVVETKYTRYTYAPPDANSDNAIGEAVSAVEKGDSLEITDKNGKVTTVKKSEIHDVIKPGMWWEIRR